MRFTWLIRTLGRSGVTVWPVDWVRAAGDRGRLPLLGFAIVAGLAVALVACSPMAGAFGHRDMHGGGDDIRSEQRVDTSADTVVQITDFAFSPGNLRVAAGTSVTWVNRDAVQHTATDAGRSWDTGLLAQDESFTIRFDVPGVYDYFCIPHPNMKARIEVVAA